MEGVGVFVYNFYLMYQEVVSTYIGYKLFILSIIICILLMIGVYICYFVGHILYLGYVLIEC